MYSHPLYNSSKIIGHWFRCYRDFSSFRIIPIPMQIQLQKPHFCHFFSNCVSFWSHFTNIIKSNPGAQSIFVHGYINILLHCDAISTSPKYIPIYHITQKQWKLQNQGNFHQNPLFLQCFIKTKRKIDRRPRFQPYRVWTLIPNFLFLTIILKSALSILYT